MWNIAPQACCQTCNDAILAVASSFRIWPSLN